jgi:LCP family protein required for cell wall assembly
MVAFRKHYLIEGEEEPKPRRRWVRVLKWIGWGILILIIATFGLLWYSLSKLSINPLGFGPLSSQDGRTNILVLGIGDPGHAGQNLTDTMLLISINHQDNEVAMISIPRDLRVDIPGYGFSKINAANAEGGPSLAEQTVSNTLDVPIQYYVKSDFNGLGAIVDAVGGLNVTVTQELKDTEYPCANNENDVCGLDIKPGQYHMNGATVLEYTRCRKGTCGNDFGRAARQQQIIGLLRDKIAKPSTYLNPAADTALLGAISNNMQTDLSVNRMIEVGFDMKHAKKTISFVFSTSPGGLLTGAGDGSSDLVPIEGDFSQMQEFTQNIFTETIPKPADQ